MSSPAGAAVLVAHKAGDGTLQTDSATGTVRFDGQGVAYGRVNGKGTIKVKGTSFSVGHWSSRKKASTGWWTYSGRNMSLSVSELRAPADHGRRHRRPGRRRRHRLLKGSKGRYLLNSSGWRAMPSGGRSFSL